MTATLAVLISGNGSNLQAIIDAVTAGGLPAQIAVVVSNRRAAYGLERARRTNIPVRYHPLKPYRDADRSRAQYDADLAALVSEYAPTGSCWPAGCTFSAITFCAAFPTAW